MGTRGRAKFRFLIILSFIFITQFYETIAKSGGGRGGRSRKGGGGGDESGLSGWGMVVIIVGVFTTICCCAGCCKLWCTGGGDNNFKTSDGDEEKIEMNNEINSNQMTDLMIQQEGFSQRVR